MTVVTCVEEVKNTLVLNNRAGPKPIAVALTVVAAATFLSPTVYEGLEGANRHTLRFERGLEDVLFLLYQ